MKDVNKVILLGRVGKDPKIKVFDNGNKIADFSFATGERYKDKDGEWQTKTEWHYITTFGKTADMVERSVHKGSRLYIEGTLEYKEWSDNDGVLKKITKIKAWIVGLQDKSEKSSDKPARVPAQAEGNIVSAPIDSEDHLPF